MSDEVLVKVEGVRKKFCRSLKKSLWYGMKDMAAELVGGSHQHDKLRDGEFWAVNDVSFELKRGECVGLIGRNGAGKTTLLKMLNGLIKPDHGRIEMRGRVGALIALGAGFNPILTGRENIYVNGSVLGLSKREIDGKLEEIIDFADIREFVDSPVQSYSSGMQVRLGFAVATAMEPDVLLIDEVLAVGDVSFRTKCYNRIEKIREKTAIILVSHNMSDIGRACSEGMVFERGRVIGISQTFAAIQLYDSLNSGGNIFQQCEPGYQFINASFGPEMITWGGEVEAVVSIVSPDNLVRPILRIVLIDQAETWVAEWRSTNNAPDIRIKRGVNCLRIKLGPILLKSGRYFANFILSEPSKSQYLIISHKQRTLEVTNNIWGFTNYQLKGPCLPNATTQ